MAYIEFIQGEDGKRRRIGPMGEKEEMAARDIWQVGNSCSIPKTLFDCALTLFCTGEERRRSSQTHE